jgi:TonB family protein
METMGRLFSRAVAVSVLIAGAIAPSGGPLASEADSGWQTPELPITEFPPDKDMYAAEARRKGVEGRVLVAFDIATSGRAQNISVIWAEQPLLQAASVRLLSQTRFEVPSNWSKSGAWRRWRVGLVYCLPPSGQSDDFAIPTRTIYITGDRFPGAPSPPSPSNGAAGPCAAGR